MNIEADANHHRDQIEKSLESFKDDFSALTTKQLVDMIDNAWIDGATHVMKTVHEIRRKAELYEN